MRLFFLLAVARGLTLEKLIIYSRHGIRVPYALPGGADLYWKTPRDWYTDYAAKNGEVGGESSSEGDASGNSSDGIGAKEPGPPARAPPRPFVEGGRAFSAKHGTLPRFRDGVV